MKTQPNKIAKIASKLDCKTNQSSKGDTEVAANIRDPTIGSKMAVVRIFTITEANKTIKTKGSKALIVPKKVPRGKSSLL